MIKINDNWYVNPTHIQYANYNPNADSGMGKLELAMANGAVLTITDAAAAKLWEKLQSYLVQG